MAKQPSGPPLEGTVSIVGVRPRVAAGQRDAPVANLLVSLSGGSGQTIVAVTFSVSLNIPVTGRARLTDDATGAVIAESTRSGSGYLFRDVPVAPPRSRAARRFRITNLRGNASGLGGGLAGTPVIAFVSISAPFRIAVSGSQQIVSATE